MCKSTSFLCTHAKTPHLNTEVSSMARTSCNSSRCPRAAAAKSGQQSSCFRPKKNTTIYRIICCDLWFQTWGRQLSTSSCHTCHLVFTLQSLHQPYINQWQLVVDAGSLLSYRNHLTKWFLLGDVSNILNHQWNTAWLHIVHINVCSLLSYSYRITKYEECSGLTL